MRQLRHIIGSGLVVGALVLQSAAPAAALGVPAAPATPTVLAHLDPWLEGQLPGLAATAKIEVIVHGVDFATADRAVRDHGLSTAHPLYREFAHIDAAVALGTAPQIRSLLNVPGLTFLEGNQPYDWYTNTSHQATNQVAAEEAYAGYAALPNGLDGRGVGIAIIDSGVDWTSPMFNDVNKTPMDPTDDVNKVVRRLRVAHPCAFLNPTANPVVFDTACMVEAPQGSDVTAIGGHGTHVAGIAGGYVVNDPVGNRTLRGAAPGAQITEIGTGAVIVVLGSAMAMNWVHLHHADPCAGRPVNYSGFESCAPIKVTNHSYGPTGGGAYDPASTEAKLNKLLVEAGITTVWAAGNDGSNSTVSKTNPPAGDPNGGVIVVANYNDANTGTRGGGLSTSSSTGKAADQNTFPDLAAPGTAITSACSPVLAICRGLVVENPNYGTISGTSMAAPHVAGIAAVLIQAAADLHANGIALHPQYDPDGNGVLRPVDIENLLEDTAEQKSALAEAVKATGATDWRNLVDDKGATSVTSYDWGHGLVDVKAALDVLTQDTPSGGGGPAVSCTPLITDKLGDTLVPGQSGLDLATGDIRALPNGTLELVIGVPGLSDSSAFASNGDRFSFFFTVGGRSFGAMVERLVRESQLLAPNFFLREGSTTIAGSGLTGAFDYTAKTITFNITPAIQTLTGGLISQARPMSALGIEARGFVAAVSEINDSASSSCLFPPVSTDRVVTVADTAASEGAGKATVTLTLNGASDGTNTVLVSTSNGTATAGEDYTGIGSAIVTFANGATSTTLDVMLLEDTLVEGNETFTVSVAAGNKTTVGTPGSATVTITDNDDEVETALVTVTPATVEEAAGATLDVTFALADPAVDDVVIHAATVEEDGDATAGEDYLAVDTTVIIPAGQTTRTVSIPVLDDDLVEGTEIVNLDLEIVGGDATFASSLLVHRAVNQITDVDDQPVPDASVTVAQIDGQPAASRIFLQKGRTFAIDGTAVLPSSGGGGGGGGGGNDGLIADAGNSQHVAIGTSAELFATAFGGDGPHLFSWSYDGGTARFANAAAMTTTFSTAGLSAGAHQVKLTVTDQATGDTDTDTVLLSLHNGGLRTLLDANGTVGPDFLGFVEGDIRHPFTVAQGSVDLTLQLAFEDPIEVSDLDLTVDDPSNAHDGNEDGYTSNNPETIVIAAPAPGSWAALVTGYLSTLTDYHLTVTANVPAPDPRPVVSLPLSYDFAVGATQLLASSVAGGTQPVALEWDLDNDGVTDATGATTTTTFPQGQHLVSLKATDAAGFEHRVVTAVRVGNVTTTSTSGLVVVAVTDTGINAYHTDFSAAAFPDMEIRALTNNFTRHPSEYIAGYPADSQALNLTLGQGYYPAQDQATINGIQLGKLYWIPGTKIIGARDDGSASGTDTVKLLDEDGHGTASASVAVGNIYGFCPSCLLAVGEGFNATSGGVVENEEYFHAAKWVDITSNSFGPQANAGFGPLTPPTQPKASAEGGQIAMYAAGNGVENGFIVPVQTYLPSSMGPDWIVRVGAAHSTSRQPILGDGNPVDISSFGAGPIPAAGIGGPNAIGSHSGTSSATPKSAGALGLVLRAARAAMGDTTVGWGAGVVANGSPVGTGMLADGVLTRKELLTAFFKTAEHHPNGTTVQFQVTVPSNPLQYLFEGYGLAEPASAARAIEVLMGTRPMPTRTAEDTFFREFDEPIRDFLYGGYNEAADADNGGASSTGLFSSEASRAELLAVLETGSLDALLQWWTSNVGEMPNQTTSAGGESTVDGVVEVAVVRAGDEATGWKPAIDSSADGSFSSWTFDATALDLGEWDVHARVVQADGTVLALDGPYTFKVTMPMDAGCAVYNTRLGDDIAGDAILFDEQGLPAALSTASLDLRQLDVSTNADGSLAFTLRVKDLDDEYHLIGERFIVDFTLGGTTFQLVASRNLRDDTGGFGGVFVTTPPFQVVKGTSKATITGAFDAAADEVRWTVPKTIFSGAHVADFAAGAELVFTNATGGRDNATGYHGLDDMVSNGCRYFVGQDIVVPAVATIADATVAENGSSVTMTVLLDRPAVRNETVLVSTVDDTATAGEDYSPLDGRVVTFAVGSAEATFQVDLLDDAWFEGDEQFVVSLAAGVDTVVGTPGVATVTILEDDNVPPTLSVRPATVVENPGATLDVLLTLDAPAAGDVEVTVRNIVTGVADEATADVDYVSLNEVVTILAGEVQALVSVAVIDDDETEPTESVTLAFDIDGRYAWFSDDGRHVEVVNTITDMPDRILPTVAITGGTVEEPAIGGTSLLPFTVEVAGDVKEPVVVDLEFAPGSTAGAGDHNGSLSSTRLTFTAPGTQVVTVGVFGDDVVEGDETVLVGIVQGSAAGAEIAGDRIAVGTIIDTTVPPLPAASIADVRVTEGNGGQTTAVFVVTLDRPAPKAIALTATTAAGTATAGVDYVQRVGAPVVIPAGATSAEFHVAVNGDKKVEADETFTVTLAGADVTFSRSVAIGTIVNDDLPEADIKSFSVKERTAAAMGVIQVEVELSEAAPQTIRVWVSSQDGGKHAAATAGEDYLAVGTWVVFQAGQKVATFGVRIFDDEIDEPNETFTLTLSRPEGMLIDKGVAIVTIKDDDKK